MIKNLIMALSGANCMFIGISNNLLPWIVNNMMLMDKM